jgi:hypothetical protein
MDRTRWLALTVLLALAVLVCASFGHRAVMRDAGKKWGRPSHSHPQTHRS